MGEMGKTKRITLPEVVGIKVQGYVKVSLAIDDAKPDETIVQGGVTVGMKYDSKEQGIIGGAIAEVAFRPEFNMKHGLTADSLVPTLSLLGSTPMPITSDPVDIFKMFLVEILKKVFGALYNQVGSSSGLAYGFESQLGDKDSLGCFFAPDLTTPTPCDALVKKYCWVEEMRRKADVKNADNEVFCCVDGKWDNEIFLNDFSFILSKGEREACTAWHEKIPTTAKCAAKTVVVANSTSDVVASESTSGSTSSSSPEADSSVSESTASSFVELVESYFMKDDTSAAQEKTSKTGLCASIGSHLDMPLRLLEVMSAEMRRSNETLAPLFKQLDSLRPENTAGFDVGISATFLQVRSNMKALRAEFTALKYMLSSFVNMDPDTPPTYINNALESVASDIVNDGSTTGMGAMGSSMKLNVDEVLLRMDGYKKNMARLVNAFACMSVFYGETNANDPTQSCDEWLTGGIAGEDEGVGNLSPQAARSANTTAAAPTTTTLNVTTLKLRIASIMSKEAPLTFAMMPSIGNFFVATKQVYSSVGDAAKAIKSVFTGVADLDSEMGRAKVRVRSVWCVCECANVRVSVSVLVLVALF